MSQNWRFMLKTCQSILNICPVWVLESLKIVAADLSCFNRSQQTPSHTQAPPPTHTLRLSLLQCHHHYIQPGGSTIKLYCLEVTTAWCKGRTHLLTHTAETSTFGHCSSRLDLNQYMLEIKRFNIPLPILWAMNLQNRLLFGNLMQCQAQ